MSEKWNSDELPDWTEEDERILVLQNASTLLPPSRDGITRYDDFMIIAEDWDGRKHLDATLLNQLPKDALLLGEAPMHFEHAEAKVINDRFQFVRGFFLKKLVKEILQKKYQGNAEAATRDVGNNPSHEFFEVFLDLSSTELVVKNRIMIKRLFESGNENIVTETDKECIDEFNKDVLTILQTLVSPLSSQPMQTTTHRNMSQMPTMIIARDKLHNGSWMKYLRSIVNTPQQDGLGLALLGILNDFRNMIPVAEEYYFHGTQDTFNQMLSDPTVPVLSKEWFHFLGNMEDATRFTQELTNIKAELMEIFQTLRSIFFQDEDHKNRIEAVITGFQKPIDDTLSTLLAIRKDRGRSSEVA